MVNNRQRSLGAFIITFGVLALVIGVFMFAVFPGLTKSTINLRLGDGVFHADLALNDNARTKGLSGLTKLDSDQALLMAFPRDGKWGIWMKEMKFPIDIVWLNADKKAVYIIKDAQPDSYPDVFEPKIPARYVIELPAGTVSSKAITLNSRAIFQINVSDVK